MRYHADFENARKRLAKEKEEFLKFANEDLICEFLPIFDNFDRAVASMPNSEQTKPILDGVLMIQKELKKVLEKSGGNK